MENKHVYEESVKAPVLALNAALETEFGPGKMFRPYRDVRFAADKTPYKTHQGVSFGEAGTYFQISAAGLYLGGGHWHSESEQVTRLRRAVDDERHGPALEKAVTSLRRRGWTIGGEQLTRVPSGYPKDHPRAELLRYKTLTAGRDLGAPEWLETPAAAAEIAGAWRQLRPLVTWLHDHLS